MLLNLKHFDRRTENASWSYLFSNRLWHRHPGIGPRGGGARLRIVAPAGAHPHSEIAPHPISRRRGAAQMLFSYARPVRGAVVCGRCDHEDPARHRHLPDPATRPDCDREVRGQPRSVVEWPIPFWYRRRLERRRNGEPRGALPDALQADARTHTGDEGSLDRRGGSLPRGNGELRSRVVLP